MNRQQRRAAAKQGVAAPIEGALAQAIGFHQSGRLPEAEALYRQILARTPAQVDCLNLLGALHSAKGDHHQALSFLDQALAINSNIPEIHNNRGVALESLNRFEEAEVHYLRALQIRPGFTDALTNLGFVRLKKGDEAGAVEALRQTVALKPDNAEAFNSLGVLLHRRGQVVEAADCFDRAAQLKPTLGLAIRNHGLALLDLARSAEAETRFSQALALSSRDLESFIGLASARQAQGRIVEALKGVVGGFGEYDCPEIRTKFAELIILAPSVSLDRDMVPLLTRAVSEPWARPATLVMVSLALLEREEPEARLNSPLLAALLTSTPIADLRWEKRLTEERQALLAGGDADLEFACNLARQCFITEYCYAESNEETEKVAALEARIEHDCSSLTALELATLAAYRRLGGLAGAERLAAQNWPTPIQEVLRQQITEPDEEAALAASLPAATEIEDSISREVRAQYEVNPYPRWVRAAPPGPAITINQFLRRQLPHSPFEPLEVHGDLTILIAGAGTGQQAVEAARRHPDASVTGVDLSRASLGYAARMARALGLANLSLAQADILQLGSLARRFHLIESGGVLHHMADPLAGWRVLTSLLHPRGVMRIGLYSETGRRDVTIAQGLIGRREASPAALRQLRQELISRQDDPRIGGILKSSDFFSLSECRDLLLHVHEHRLTLPIIAEWLSTLGLRFLGFECAATISAGYRSRFPQDGSMTDLAGWHVFETENPDSFIGMYQFWVQKT